MMRTATTKAHAAAHRARVALVATGLTAMALCVGPGIARGETTEVLLDHIGPRWLGSQWHDNFGWTVKAPGDLNGDGFGDFAVSSPQDDGPPSFESSVRIYFGSPEPAWDRVDADWQDVRISDGKIGVDAVFQFSFISDATGDGLTDLLVVEPKAAEAGKVLLHQGGGTDWPSEIAAIDAVARWDGYLQDEITLIAEETRPSRALGGDLNGDGLADIVIVSELFHRVWIQYSSSPYSGTTTLDSLTTVLAECTGEVPGSEFGEDGRIADFNGDGTDDLAISAPGCENNTGRVFVWYGATAGLQSSPDLVIPGGEYLGGSLETADLNGDGRADLFVQERLAPAADRGNLWVFFGAAAGLATTPDFKLIGGFSDRRFGASVAVLDDISVPADGLADIAVGAPDAAYAGIGQGAVYIFEGQSEWPEELSSDDALYRVVGSHRDASFGSSLAAVDDFDGDGHQELIIGEPNYTEGDTENDYRRGRIYLFNSLPDRDEDADGVTTLAGDCNDDDAAVRPTALEICDGIDNNCNHQIDEGCDEGDDDDTSAGDDDDSTAGDEPGCQCSAIATRSGAGLLLALWGLAVLALRRYSGRRTE